MSERRMMHRPGQRLLQLTVCSVLVISSLEIWAQPATSALATKSTYVNPSTWPGVLILQSGVVPAGNPLAEADHKLLAAALSNKDSQVLLAVEPETHAAVELTSVLNGHESQVVRLSVTDWCSQLNDAGAVATWTTCDSIWIDVSSETANAIKQLDTASHERLKKCLDTVLSNGGFVRVSGDLGWLGLNATNGRTVLLEHCTICTTIPEKEGSDSLLQVCIPEGARCAFAKRQVVNIAKEPAVEIKLPPTEHYTAALAKTLREGEAIDWVQWQRARLERQLPHYPGRDRVEHALAGGSLVIGGGGGMPEEVWKRFVELAGGKNARIVILPTAVEDPKAEPAFEERVLKLAGAGQVVTLAQHQRSEVEDEAFLAELDQATGVWFGGGRQWRFVDAYWGTPAWEKLIAVCKRGGVIGGSSAGATIQGDLLVRGAPAGNHIMIADGYRRGLGLLPGVAIDQHFSQRNRFRELEGCLADFPAICGIGIDEQTALVVASPDQCSVIGTGSVWHYPSYDANEQFKPDSQTRSKMRTEYKSGSQFSLVPQ
ncbi:MAG: cyanophycinase [Pirellulaceae bacterium]|nr:cyanophycinase [Pirellulaceae bacterium]